MGYAVNTCCLEFKSPSEGKSDSISLRTLAAFLVVLHGLLRKSKIEQLRSNETLAFAPTAANLKWFGFKFLSH